MGVSRESEEQAVLIPDPDLRETEELEDCEDVNHLTDLGEGNFTEDSIPFEIIETTIDEIVDNSSSDSYEEANPAEKKHSAESKNAHCDKLLLQQEQNTLDVGEKAISSCQFKVSWASIFCSSRKNANSTWLLSPIF